MKRAPTPDEVDALYRKIGLGVWHLQHLEYALHVLLTTKVDVKVPGSMPAEAVRAAFHGHTRKTLGAALRTAKDNAALPQTLQSELDAFLTERNWLIHRSIDDHAEGMFSEEGRRSAMTRLDQFVSEAQRLKELVIADFSAYAQSQGVSLSKATSAAHEQVARLRGEA